VSIDMFGCFRYGLEPIANLRGNITANLNGEVKLTILTKHEN
jgi:hypothetical protein